LCTENYASGSCKREACLELLTQAKAAGHRVLLFSQFTSMLDILEDDLKNAGISYMVLKGSTPAAQRARMVNEFNAGKGDVFLISLKAGGTGLNLTSAEAVIHFDPWWNVSAQNQASDRAYRLGQHRNVQIIRLIAKNTIEEKILDMQKQKQALSNSILDINENILTCIIFNLNAFSAIGLCFS
jgi:SNF2 family DNA or RNA helicase